MFAASRRRSGTEREEKKACQYPKETSMSRGFTKRHASTHMPMPVYTQPHAPRTHLYLSSGDLWRAAHVVGVCCRKPPPPHHTYGMAPPAEFVFPSEKTAVDTAAISGSDSG